MPVAKRLISGLIAALLVPASLNLLASPTHAQGDSRQTAAVNLFQKQDYKGAAALFESIGTENPSATPIYYLALCEIQLHNQARAVQLFQKICHDWPASPEAVHATTYLKQSASAPPKTPADAKAASDSKGEGQPELKSSVSHISKTEWEALPSKTRILIHRERGHLMIDAKVNGQWGKFAFDTGATRCGIGLYDYPNMFTKAQLDSAKRIGISRPQGLVIGWDLVADVTVQDITRRVGFIVLPERNVCVIGQNFFKEYNCQIDDFYIRLTKAPYQDDSQNLASAGTSNGAPGAASGSSATATSSTTAASNISATNKLAKTGQSQAGNTTSGGIISNATRNSINNSMVISDLKNPPTKPAQDRYTISFERQQDTMLIDILVNGVPVKAIFDTGCAPDGIVCHPNFAEIAHMQPMSRRLDRMQIGSIIRMDVPVYYAGGLQYPLVGPKIFNRPYTIDPVNKLIKFDY